MKYQIAFTDWVKHDWLLLLILTTTIAVGPVAFYFFFILLCLVAFTNREYCIPVLFFSGSIKAIPYVSDFPIDFTALSLVFFLVGSFLNFLRNRSLHPSKLWFCGFLMLLIILVIQSIIVTPASFFYLQRSGFFVLLNISIVLMLFLFWRMNEPGKTLTAFINFSVLIGLIWIGLGVHNQIFGKVIRDIKPPHDAMWHISSFGEDYMVFSIFAMMAMLALGLTFFYKRKTVVMMILMTVLMYGMLSSPARGLTLGFLLSLIVLSLYSFKGRLRYSALMTISAIGVIAAILIFSFKEHLSVALTRLTNYSTAGRSISYRIEYITEAIHRWTDSMFLGTGIDSVIYYNGAVGTHVHNVFLESVIEFGIIGGLPFLVFFGLTIVYFHYLFKAAVKRNDLKIQWLLLVFFIFFIFGMFSGSLSQMRSLWMMMGLIIIIYIDLAPRYEVIPSHPKLNEKDPGSSPAPGA